MKIEIKEATVTSNISQDNVTAMSISVDGMEHIMTLLTNLYKDPELAVIREYYTNAVDAHVAAGNKSPVLVTLPTWDTPNYTVQDFGVGMSKHDIENIYAQYGASTKRNTNDQVGAFGLGCKSALTIATQFTVVSVKDGWRTTALISKTESGVNTVNIISSVDTDEPNGTTVRIPVPGSISGFISKANHFFSFSAPGAVLVNNETPDDAFEGARKITDPANLDKVMYLKPKVDGTSYIIMGNVPYALSQEEIRLSLERLNSSATAGFIRMPKYFPVPIGAVDLTPSREGLRFTDKTNDVIDDYMSFILNDVKSIAQDNINEAKTLDEFFESWGKWKEIVDIPRQWKGEQVPVRLILEKPVHTIERSSWGSTSHSDGATIPLVAKDGYQRYGRRFLVKGYAAADYKKVNAYIGNYLTATGLTTGVFSVSDDEELFTNKWVLMQDRFTIIDGSDIIEVGREQRKKERLEAAKNGQPSKRAVTYPVLFVKEGKIRWVPVKDIAAGSPYVHLSLVGGTIAEIIRLTYRSHGRTRDVAANSIELIKYLTDSDQIILLNSARTSKALAERVKNTRCMSTDVQKVVDNSASLITDEVIRHHGIQQSQWKRFLTNSGISTVVSTIKDSRIKEIIEPTAPTLSAYEKWEKTRKAMNFIWYFRVKADLDIDTEKTGLATEELDKKYPLIGALNSFEASRSKEHVIKYLNMVHDEEEALASAKV